MANVEQWVPSNDQHFRFVIVASVRLPVMVIWTNQNLNSNYPVIVHCEQIFYSKFNLISSSSVDFFFVFITLFHKLVEAFVHIDLLEMSMIHCMCWHVFLVDIKNIIHAIHPAIQLYRLRLIFFVSI